MMSPSFVLQQIFQTTKNLGSLSGSIPPEPSKKGGDDRDGE